MAGVSGGVRIAPRVPQYQTLCVAAAAPNSRPAIHQFSWAKVRAESTDARVANVR